MIPNDAEGAMDSLLKEIDHEMEVTIGTIDAQEDHSKQKEETEATNQQTWKLPLQDIGDETMDMLVKHNTKNNVINPNFNKKDVDTNESPKNNNDKNVVFNDNVQLLELSANMDESVLMSTPTKSDIDISPNKVLINLGDDIANESNEDNKLPLDNKTESEDSDLVSTMLLSKIPITHTENINDFYEKKSTDIRASTSRISSVSSDIEGTPLPTTVQTDQFELLKQAMKQTFEEDNNSNIDISPLKESLLSSELKTKQNLSIEQNEETSVDSIDNSVIHNSEYEVHARSNEREEENENDFENSIEDLEISTHVIEKSPSIEAISTLDPNTDNNKEHFIINNITKDSTFIEVTSDSKIQIDLKDSPENTLHTNEDQKEANTENVASETNIKETDQVIHIPTLTEEEISTITNITNDTETTEEGSKAEEDAKNSDVSNSQNSESINTTITNSLIGIDQNLTNKSSDITNDYEEPPKENELKSSPDVIEKGHSSIEHFDDEKITNSSALGTSNYISIPLDTLQEATPVTDSGKTFELQNQDSDNINSERIQNLNGSTPVEEKFNADDELLKTNQSHITQNKDKSNINEIDNSGTTSIVSDHVVAPILPPLPKIDKIFIDDPFGEEYDISNDSIDLTKSTRPGDYLSIWHIQEEELKQVSPASTTNSQFSNRILSNASSNASAESRISSTAFKFKPRIVSRSRYINPESRVNSFNISEEMILPQLYGALDPMRRSSRMSRTIQNSIKANRQKSEQYAGTRKYSIEIQPNQESRISSRIISNKLEEVSSENDKVETMNNSITMDGSFQLLPSFLDNSFGEQLDLTFSKFAKDVLSLRSSSLAQSEIHDNSINIWGEDNFIGNTSKNNDHNAMLDSKNKLLEVTDDEKSISESINKDIFADGILKSSIFNDITVSRGLNINGLDVDLSDSESVRVSLLTAETDASESGTPIKNTVKDSHVSSPFKVVNISKWKNQDGPESDHEVEEIAEIQIEAEKSSESIADISPIKMKPFVDTVVIEEPSQTALVDAGSLYLKLKGCLNIKLTGIKHHDARYCFEFDNGRNSIQTAWAVIPSDGDIRVNHDFESTVFEVGSKLYVTLKCKYTPPKTEIVEVVEKVLIPKKKLFGKAEYKYEKRFVQRDSKKDEWNNLFARDGSFGRAEVLLDHTFLNSVKYNKRNCTFDMMNEWTRLNDKENIENVFNIPRKPKYKVADLKMEVCYLDRVSNKEVFPVSFDKCEMIIKKYKEQLLISKEGYLMQEGGDVCNNLVRRFFKLQGTDLIGYHEVSNLPVVTINMLKVIDVVSSDDLKEEEGKQRSGNSKRNFTDHVLFGGCIQLVFTDEEVINLYADTSAQEKIEWYSKLKKTVDLNICHQPWVTKLAEAQKLEEC
ncbi:hypothetical protein Kpol_520p2 [Vanderwaltozyma polyspora DSM 70294]|uniref:Bud site selection protein 4 n=1 Tax=Vanderwaltozyma polyspora (strain ATCC 22028 / DSM 70294 / BCRC 21397 / CBS 2163 / NBRC 10782 / NRRL Y-8283 / UCD 57-17) TaxID=436907 RepID=BUD4_VANPO|nr:uncharacterized protein Kpol_520p2 [Vanderwaltozyma polyspora DSM 70294]A7TM88.1 RecName: Full=Bud site selection protein 4 [Vanderwaltozyma polyspora DSM 70294]EDO16582.1 hypothetical protein Kpol_520p2 [Vanderwaltozyma polyspora DSM 70294]